MNPFSLAKIVFALILCSAGCITRVLLLLTHGAAQTYPEIHQKISQGLTESPYVCGRNASASLRKQLSRFGA